MPIPENQQQALVARLMQACGGSYSPETRRKFYISGPQWAAAYQGQALFHAPTREAVGFEEVIRRYAEIGIGYWTTHDTDVIPTEALGRDRQAEIVARIGKALAENGVRCSMVTTETFYHAVWAASPAAESPEVREYAKFRVKNTVEIGHELGANLRGLLAGIAGLLCAGRDRRDRYPTLVCRSSQRGLRPRSGSRRRQGPPARSSTAWRRSRSSRRPKSCCPPATPCWPSSPRAC